METTVFAHTKFWLLVLFSTVLPFSIYGALLAKRSISRLVVLLFGFALVAIAGVDVYLLQSLATLAKATPSLLDDKVFSSELSVALYLLPAMFGGIGINVVSHALVRHLDAAEGSFRKSHWGPSQFARRRRLRRADGRPAPTTFRAESDRTGAR